MPFLVPNALSYLFLLGTASSTCYFPNGIPLGSSSAPTGSHWFEYQPCNPDPNAISMCCTTNRTSDRADTCLPNGLCSGWTPGGSTRAKYRESCTDPDWSSRACLKDVCTDPSIGGTNVTDIGMTQCDDDGFWCCGLLPNSQSCCQIRDGMRIFLASTVGIGDNIIGTPSASMSSQSSPTGVYLAASTSSTTSPPSVPSPQFVPSTPSAASTSCTTSGLSTDLLASSTSLIQPQVSITVWTSISSVDSRASTMSTVSPTSTPSRDTESTVRERNIHIGAGVAMGAVMILLLYFLAYCVSLRRRGKQLQEGMGKADRNESGGRDMMRDSVARFEKLELDTWGEIRMMGSRDARAELHRMERERFELAVETEVEVERQT